MPPISIFVRSPATLSERRFDSDTSLTAIKAKLETVTGISAGEQVWDIYRDVEAAERGEGGRRVGDEDTLTETGVHEWECIQVSLHVRRTGTKRSGTERNSARLCCGLALAFAQSPGTSVIGALSEKPAGQPA